MKLSVIIINYGTMDMTEQAIKAFSLRENRLEYEIILVDNRSGETLDEKRFLKYNTRIIKNSRNLGFARAANQGVMKSRGDYLLFLNSDVFVHSGSISAMLEYMEENEEIAAVGPKVLFPDERYQISAGFFPGFAGEVMRITGLYKLVPYSTFLGRNGVEPKNQSIREVDWLSGGCLLARKCAMTDLGGFDPKFFLGVEDIDFCYRAKQAGWKIVYMPNVKVIHKHGASSGAGGTRSVLRMVFDRNGLNYFFKKHYSRKIIQRKLLWALANSKILFFKLYNKFSGKK